MYMTLQKVKKRDHERCVILNEKSLCVVCVCVCSYTLAIDVDSADCLDIFC